MPLSPPVIKATLIGKYLYVFFLVLLFHTLFNSLPEPTYVSYPQSGGGDMYAYKINIFYQQFDHFLSILSLIPQYQEELEIEQGMGDMDIFLLIISKLVRIC